jgi:uncharacterized membrane protein YqhA
MASRNHTILFLGGKIISAKYVYASVIMIIVGLFEMFVTPLILKHLWAKRPPPNTAYVLQTTRMSGLIVVIMGVSFLVGLFG